MARWQVGHTTLTLKTANLAVKAVNLAVKPMNLAVKVAVKMWLKEDDVEKKEKKEKCGTHQRWCEEKIDK